MLRSPERTCAATERWIGQRVGIKKPEPLNASRLVRRGDDMVKRELRKTIRQDGFDLKLAIDNRHRVVDMWRAEGELVCAVWLRGECEWGFLPEKWRASVRADIQRPLFGGGR